MRNLYGLYSINNWYDTWSYQYIFDSFSKREGKTQSIRKRKATNYIRVSKEIDISEQLFMKCTKYIESIHSQINQNFQKHILDLTNCNGSNIYNIKENLIIAMKTDLDNI